MASKWPESLGFDPNAIHNRPFISLCGLKGSVWPYKALYAPRHVIPLTFYLKALKTQYRAWINRKIPADVTFT